MPALNRDAANRDPIVMSSLSNQMALQSKGDTATHCA